MKTVLADFLRTYWLVALMVAATLAILAVTLSGIRTDHDGLRAAAQRQAAAHQRADSLTRAGRAAYEAARNETDAAAAYDTAAMNWAQKATALHRHTHPRHAASPSPAAADSALQAARQFLANY